MKKRFEYTSEVSVLVSIFTTICFMFIFSLKNYFQRTILVITFQLSHK